jgi:pyroglutamyl-peptidase
VKILLTGFVPFGEVETNPSWLIVEAFTSGNHFPGVIPVVLPTEYAGAGERLRQLLQHERPDAVVCLGVAASRKEINLERVALNLNDASIPDNADDLATGRLIDPDGPIAYWSTLPLDAMLAALRERDIPAVISNHAGAYVCNHVFYTARHWLEQNGLAIPCGFIHVPALRESEEQETGLPLETMMQAVEICLEPVMNYTTKTKR